MSNFSGSFSFPPFPFSPGERGLLRIMGFVEAQICNKFLSERFLGPGCAGPQDYSSVKGPKEQIWVIVAILGLSEGSTCKPQDKAFCVLHVLFFTSQKDLSSANSLTLYFWNVFLAASLQIWAANLIAVSETFWSLLCLSSFDVSVDLSSLMSV